MDEGTNQKDRDQEQGRTEGYKVGKKEDKSKLATMAKENRFLRKGACNEKHFKGFKADRGETEHKRTAIRQKK